VRTAAPHLEDGVRMACVQRPEGTRMLHAPPIGRRTAASGKPASWQPPNSGGEMILEGRDEEVVVAGGRLVGDWAWQPRSPVSLRCRR
jgi:hypothetical protein